MTATTPIFTRTAAIFAAAAILAAPAALRSGPRDPFPIGSSMMSQGAIIDSEGASGREPWVSAAYCRDSMRWGASAAVVDYHGGGNATQYAAGGFGTAGRVIGKASLMQLDVMGVYYEQDAALSAGSSWRFLSFGIDLHGYRAGLYGRPNDIRTSAAAGAAVAVQNRRISADAAIQNITVYSSGDPNADPFISVALRACTVRNKYGSQGAMIKITPDDNAPLRFILAQEYRIGDKFALAASIASNPTTIGFGIAIDKSTVNGTAAVVNHPFLGWSKGMSVDYGK